MEKPIVSTYIAIVSNYRNFPDITVTVNKVSENDGFREDILYIAESDYAIWTPGNPANPYRHSGCGNTVEKSVSDALKTFYVDTGCYPNNQVFITDAKSNYETATFIDGNGDECTYDEVRKIISENTPC